MRFTTNATRYSLPVSALMLMMILAACAGAPTVPETPIPEPEPSPPTSLPRLGWTIQAGAFREVDNAVRFTAKLQQRGLDAYHFIDESELYKVRFGNFATRGEALRWAEALTAEGILTEYFIVSPETSAAARYAADDTYRLREEIVRTAARFKGKPYRWGGDSARSGFDCSGLTKVVYELNGLELPRTSRQQWETGKPVSRERLAKGDLVFFATTGGRRVSHVGIYTGNNRFLHAPGRGRSIREASLDNRYFRKRYLGARTYL